MGPEVTVNESITIANEWDRAYFLPMLPGPEVDLSSYDLLNGLGSA